MNIRRLTGLGVTAAAVSALLVLSCNSALARPITDDGTSASSTGSSSSTAADSPDVPDDGVVVISGPGVPYRLTPYPDDAANSSDGEANDPDASPDGVDPAGCTLYPTVVYQRTSSNKQAVGFKPYTQCNYAVSSIKQTSRLYKYHLFGTATETVGPSFSVQNSGVASLTQRNIEVYCTNTKSTKSFGIANGTLVIAGHTYYSQVRTSNSNLNCGT